MSDELESHLRAEFGRAAERAPRAPSRFPAEVVSRSHRRRTARRALVAGVCVAVIVVPTGLMAASGTDGDVTTGTVAPSGPLQDYTGDEYRIGEVVTVTNPSQKRDLDLWYARTDKGTVLCAHRRDRTGGTTSSCGEPLGTEKATEQGSTGGFPAPATGLVLYFGTARDGVSGVTALTGAGKVPGTVHRPKDAPQGIWTVTVPSDKTVTAFEFAGREGEPNTRIERERTVSPEAVAKPQGATVEMPGNLVVGLYETPDRTLIWKLNGQAVGGLHPLTPGRAVVENGGPDQPLIDMGGRPMNVILSDHKKHWFGITSTETARVELVFGDGTTVKAGTRPDPWKIGGFRLFAGTQRHSEDLYDDGFRIIGYDENGAELWREDSDE
ncbi:hypothetical protein [Nonomuraea longicatena]|uniref:Uncharacterized protein n=1 Tax=Nonomuraea longicatena TaxID=83682 RepID=A0ABN1QSS5_9ACTN